MANYVNPDIKTLEDIEKSNIHLWANDQEIFALVLGQSLRSKICHAMIIINGPASNIQGWWKKLLSMQRQCTCARYMLRIACVCSFGAGEGTFFVTFCI